jgi:hypothetical protein
MQKYAKYAIVILFSLMWIVVSIMRVPPGTGTYSEIGPDGSWALSLSAMWEQGKISGRDFYFTYGGVSQMLARFGQWMHQSQSAYDSLPLILLSFHLACIVLLAIFLLWMRRLSWFHTLFIYAAATFLNLFSEPTSFRVLILMLCAAGVVRTVAAGNVKQRRAWASVCGLLCLVAQLITVELGAYAVFIITASFLLLLFKVDRRSMTESLWIVLGIFLAGNLIIGFASRPAYAYHFYALEMLRGYTYGMGSNWALGLWPTLALVLAGVYALGTAVSLSRRMDARDCALLLSLAICSAVSLKSALIRSDLGHITQGLSPTVVLFLVLGLGWPISRAMKKLWMALFAALLLAWPWAGASAFLHFKSVFDGTASLPAKVKQILSASSKIEEAVPPELPLAVESARNTPVLVFPYQNSIGIALRRPLVAPVLLAINAATESLQKYYVDALDRAGPDAEVIYAVDTIGSSPIDSVQSITRAPLIFEYLWRSYELVPGQKSGAGFYLLRKRPHPKDLRIRELRFRTDHARDKGVEAILDEPAACSTVRFDLKIRYPAARFLGRPAGLEVAFSRGSAAVLRSALVPIEISRVFSTDVSLAGPDQFIEIFGPAPPPGRIWDRVQFTPRPSDWLGWPPNQVKLVSIKCLE